MRFYRRLGLAAIILVVASALINPYFLTPGEQMRIEQFLQKQTNKWFNFNNDSSNADRKNPTLLPGAREYDEFELENAACALVDDQHISVTLVIARGSNAEQSATLGKSILDRWQVTTGAITPDRIAEKWHIGSLLPAISEIKKVVDQTAASKGKKVNYAYVTADYPAYLNSLNFITGAPGSSFQTSVEMGVKSLAEKLFTNQTADGVYGAANCPGTQLVFVGLSQGAAVIHQLLTSPQLQSLALRTKAVMLISDPQRDSVNHVNIQHVSRGKPAPNGTLTDTPDIGEQFAGKAFSYCDSKDPVCAKTVKNTFNFKVHANSPKDWAAQVAQDVANSLSYD